MYLDALFVHRCSSLFISLSTEVASSTLSFSARNCSTTSEYSPSNSSINKASSKAPSSFASQTFLRLISFIFYNNYSINASGKLMTELFRLMVS